MIYLRGTSQNGGRKPVKAFKFIEEVHNCPAVRVVSSINEGVHGQTGFRPNLSISPPLSVSSLLSCFTVLRECPCTK